MDDLTNSQIVLLSILVSFVTSMASAIITTSLLDASPVQVGQTVNRVVERTIERVVPEEAENGEKEIIRETIVVTEDDQVVEAIKKNEPHIVRILPQGGGEPIAIGFIVDSSGLIVTNGASVSQNATYIARTSRGDIEVQNVYDPDDRVAFLAPSTPLQDGVSAISFASGEPQLGQTVVLFGGLQTNMIATGRITNLTASNTTSTSTPPTSTPISGIVTNITISGSSGSIILNLSGEVLGIRVGDVSTGVFVPSRLVREAMDTMKTQAGEE